MLLWVADRVIDQHGERTPGQFVGHLIVLVDHGSETLKEVLVGIRRVELN